LTNIGRHASATRVSIAAKRERDGIRFDLEDNGTGFSLEEYLERQGPRGLGLATMNERAKLMGGALEVTSRVGEGTRVCIRVPVARRGEGR
jgi:signal transduction histidine kinase